MTRSSATIRWAPPKDNGGSPITNYLIEYKTSYAYSWALSSISTKISGTEFTIDNLTEGTTYEFRVIAVNRAGKSEPSQPSQSTVLREAAGMYTCMYISK